MTGQAPMPDVPQLWHYTTAAGLYGIVTTNQLRFGDLLFLNDRTERHYGPSLVFEMLSELRDTPDLRDVAGSIEEDLTCFWPTRQYACSLSENEDSMSQWQRYGSAGSGYCIGFSAAALDALMLDGTVRRVSMLYEPEEQRREVLEAIASTAEAYRKFETARAQAGPGVFLTMAPPTAIEDAALRLKNPAFRDEREWRYLVQVADEEDFESGGADSFAISGDYVKPFIAMPPTDAASEHKLPITTVVCGPRLEPELAISAVTRFLRAHGHGEAAVRMSQLTEIWR